MASAMTAPGTTAVVSERWCSAVAASPVARSTVRSALGTVEMGDYKRDCRKTFF